jgi:thiamine-monophosphate kinase
MTRRSEFELIDAFRERLPGPHRGVVVGSGDDCAVVHAGGALSVVSVDTTVDGVHARLDLGDPLQAARDCGWRALTTALSDLAACGVGPGPGPSSDGERGERLPPEQEVASSNRGIEAYVAVTLPPEFGDDRALALADGMADAARAFGVSVIGGDVTSGPALVISATVVGWLAEGERPLTRAGARVGDLIGLTGPIGAAGAGLALTLGEFEDAALPASDAAALRAAHLRPTPQLDVGAALRAARAGGPSGSRDTGGTSDAGDTGGTSGRAGVTAAIDLSDGLVADARHLARASGVTLQVSADEIPLAVGVHAAALQLGTNPLLFAQSAGEDFVLLVTVDPAARAAAEEAGVIAWIGVAAEPRAGDAAGDVIGLPDDPDGRAGHDHRATLPN